MEAFMLLDTTPKYSMLCELDLTFQGRIDQAACEEAFAFALARNPLFTHTIDKLKNGALVWKDSGQLPPLRWLDLDEPFDATYGAPFDLMKQSGLRIWVRRGADKSQVLLHFHHACGDGMGVNGFVEDFLVGYHNALGMGPAIKPRPLEFERLKTRGEIGMGGRSLLRKIYDVFVGSYEGIKFLWQRPAPLAAGPNAPTGELLRPSYINVRLSEATTRGLRRLASSSGATTNDLLMRDLFLVLGRWNETHEGLPARRNLRVLMPQNLREGEDYRMPLANAMSFAFVTRRASWLIRPAALLDSIREETEAIRKGKLSLYFLGGLGAMRDLGLLKSIIKGPFCFSTTILTNMGDPLKNFVAALPRVEGGVQTGNLVYQGMFGVPPMRPRTSVSYSIFNHGSTMSITSRWDERRIHPQDGRQLLHEYVNQLNATAEQAGA